MTAYEYARYLKGVFKKFDRYRVDHILKYLIPEECLGMFYNAEGHSALPSIKDLVEKIESIYDTEKIWCRVDYPEPLKKGVFERSIALTE